MDHHSILDVRSIISTAILTLVNLRLSVSVCLRLRTWAQVLRESKLTSNSASTEGEHVNKLKRTLTDSYVLKDETAHTAVVMYFICVLMLTCMCFRCLIFIALAATGGVAGQRACDVLSQLLTVFYTVGYIFPYKLFWHRQRFFYFKLQLYSRLIRWWSWSVALFTSCFVLFQTMIYMPTWRYGIQNFPGKQGCILQSYNHSFNVTLTEWYLPYKFGLVGAIILLAFSLGLYAVLLYRSLIAPDSNMKEVLEDNEHLKYQLIRTSAGALLSYITPTVVPIFYWKILEGGCPSVLASQVQDLGFLLQITMMVLSLDDWKEALQLQTSKFFRRRESMDSESELQRRTRATKASSSSQGRMSFTRGNQLQPVESCENEV